MFDKKEKQLIRLVEVLALSALLQAKPSKKVEKRLKEIAFPLEIDLWFVKSAIRKILLLVNYGKIDGLKNTVNFVITVHF